MLLLENDKLEKLNEWKRRNLFFMGGVERKFDHKS